MTTDELDSLLDLLARRLTHWRERAIKAERSDAECNKHERALCSLERELE